MILNDKIKDLITERLGEITSLAECKRLADAITEDVHKKYAAAGKPQYSCSISGNTLGRILRIIDRPRKTPSHVNIFSGMGSYFLFLFVFHKYIFEFYATKV